jgi:peptidoglycan hydrolase-like protein with peptidoglycan-binding domain
VIARIEEVDRLACASRYPMSRSVAKGNKGGDVATLQECLKIFGYDTSKDKGVYGQATQAAVATLAAKTGADSQKGLYFEAGWLVFLPEDNYQVDQIDLVVGTPAPPAGAVIAQASLALTRARLADSNWLTAETSSLEDPTSGKSGQDAPIDQPVTADLDESLHVTNQVIELAESRDEVSSTALAGLQALLPAGTSSIEARLVRPAGTSELMVSAAAIVTTPQGAVCVLKVSQDSLVPVAVEVIGDWNGNAIITGQLQLGDEVRVAPAAEDRRCASN